MMMGVLEKFLVGLQLALGVWSPRIVGVKVADLQEVVEMDLLESDWRRIHHRKSMRRSGLAHCSRPGPSAW